VNGLNEYTSRTVPNAVDVIGAAYATATVSVNASAAYRKAEYYQCALPIANSIAPAWQPVTNTAVLGTTTNTASGNLLVPPATQTFGYDKDGNLTNDSVWIYVWDGENRLIMMSNMTTVATAARRKLDFAYDYMGRRVRKTVSTNNGTAWIPVSTNFFVHDGWNLVAELNPSHFALRTYMWGQDLSGTMDEAGGIGGLLLTSFYGVSATNCFVAYDGNGNVTALANAVDKTTSARYEYDPFGEPIRVTDPLGLRNPFRFSTKFCDDESGLAYFGMRYHAPVLGRFLSRDPSQEEDGANLCAFVGNDPANNFDALGTTKGGKQQKVPTNWEQATPAEIQAEIDRLIKIGDPKNNQQIKALRAWKKIRQSPGKYRGEFGRSSRASRGSVSMGGVIMTGAATAAYVIWTELSTSIDVLEMRDKIAAGLVFNDKDTPDGQMYDFVRHLDSGETAWAELDAASYAALAGGNELGALAAWDMMEQYIQDAP
jgi:RHS repeat-associated protein